MNFGPVAAEIDPVVCGTPANFKGVSRLDSVTAQHSSIVRQPNFAALNRGRHLHSVGRPSRWALPTFLVHYYSLMLYYLITLSHQVDKTPIQ